MIRFLFLSITASFVFLSTSCKENNSSSPVQASNAAITIPAANADSLFAFVEKQLGFGYRVPGTEEHRACKDWLVSKLEQYGAEVIVQEFDAQFLGREKTTAYNIIAQYNPEMKKRFLLAAHWDTRAIAEKDGDQEDRGQPIAGADDGASGVAGLLEIARILNENPIDMGVDLILFDAEDQGITNGNEQSFCLGSQYWSSNKHKRNYTAKYGILLDMVGANNAAFGKEAISRQYAPQLVDKVWSLAQGMGYSDLFVDVNFGAISDDHLYVNRVAGIPMIDIINYNFQRNRFADYHHTSDDNLDIISKRTLRRVTQVVLAVVYREAGNQF